MSMPAHAQVDPAASPSPMDSAAKMAKDAVEKGCRDIGDAGASLVFQLPACINSWWVEPFRLVIFLTVEFTNRTDPNLLQEAFMGEYGITLRFGTFISIAMVLIAMIAGVLKGGLREVLRTVTIGLPMSILGGSLAVLMAQLLIEIDKELCKIFIPQLMVDVNLWVDKVTVAYFQLDPENLVESRMSMIFMVFIVLMGLLLLLEMLMRTVTIYMAVLFFPMALATWVWSSVRRWSIYMLELIVFVIFSKLIVVVVLWFGFRILSSAYSVNNDNVALPALAVVGTMFFLAAASLPALITFLFAPQHRAINRREFVAGSSLSISRLQVAQSASSYLSRGRQRRATQPPP